MKKIATALIVGMIILKGFTEYYTTVKEAPKMYNDIQQNLQKLERSSKSIDRTWERLLIFGGGLIMGYWAGKGR
jgi:hypothetical protein